MFVAKFIRGCLLLLVVWGNSVAFAFPSIERARVQCVVNLLDNYLGHSKYDVGEENREELSGLSLVANSLSFELATVDDLQYRFEAVDCDENEFQGTIVVNFSNFRSTQDKKTYVTCELAYHCDRPLSRDYEYTLKDEKKRLVQAFSHHGGCTKCKCRNSKK